MFYSGSLPPPPVSLGNIILFQDPFNVLDVAELRLHLAEVPCMLPFACSILLPTSLPLASLMLPFRLCDAPLNLIFVDAHDVLLSASGGQVP